MKKLIVLLLVSVAMLSGCGESEEERIKREAKEELLELMKNATEAAESATDNYRNP